jgi:hypothetical protein
MEEPNPLHLDIEFEASVCYCFITRFPLFDFFFRVTINNTLCKAALTAFRSQVIFNIITYERIHRMELLSGNTSLLDRKAYEYIPKAVYTEVLEALTRIHPPKFNDTLEFTVRIS